MTHPHVVSEGFLQGLKDRGVAPKTIAAIEEHNRHAKREARERGSSKRAPATS